MSAPVDDPLSRLLKLAGTPDIPSREGTERARRAAHQSWRRAVDAHAGVSARGRSWRWLAASAAAIGMVLVLAWPRAAVAPASVARVTALSGAVTLQGTRPLHVAARIPAGATLHTANGRVALLIGDALSVRVDTNARLRFDGVDIVTLLDGNLYVDSGITSIESRLRIRTPAGEVRHLGTQFLVSVHGSRTRLRVREGRVRLTANTVEAALDLAAGDLLDAAGTSATLKHGLPSHGAEWEWVTQTAPAFDIENRPLAEFLAWLAREHGWQLVFSDAALQARTHDIRLHGSLGGLGADAMLERVSLITGVPLAARGGSLWVGAREQRR